MKGFYFLQNLDFYLARICNLLLPPNNNDNKLHTVNPPKKLLIIKLWGIGNLVIIWPLINEIKHKFPSSDITFLTFDLNKGFLEENNAINKVVYFKFTRNILKIAAQLF